MSKRLVLFIALFIILVVAFCLALLLGASKLQPKDVMYALLHPGTSGVWADIIWQVRLPRILLGLIVGAGLAASGCVFQGILRNPLADSYTLGVSGGAALGVSIGSLFGLTSYLSPVCAFAGAIVCVFLVYAVASKRHFSVSTLILSGVILSFLFSSLVLLIFAISKSEQIHATVLWLMGDLSSAEYPLLKTIWIFVMAGIAVLIVFARDLDLLTLGEEKALHLGIDAEKMRKLLFLIASFITGACVAGSGIVGFVGLMIPHLIRHMGGVRHRFLIPASSIAGAAFLVLCDTLARTIVSPLELPVGVITGIFGGLFFLIYLLRYKNWEVF